MQLNELSSPMMVAPSIAVAIGTMPRMGARRVIASADVATAAIPVRSAPAVAPAKRNRFDGVDGLDRRAQGAWKRGHCFGTIQRNSRAKCHQRGCRKNQRTHSFLRIPSRRSRGRGVLAATIMPNRIRTSDGGRVHPLFRKIPTLRPFRLSTRSGGRLFGGPARCTNGAWASN